MLELEAGVTLSMISILRATRGLSRSEVKWKSPETGSRKWAMA